MTVLVGIRSWRSAALGLVVAAVAAGFGPTAAAAARRANPTCDRIAGTTLARNDRWRVIESAPRGEEETVPVLACRRTSKPTARVRLLGNTSPDGTYGEDVIGVGRVVNNLAMVSRSSYSSQGGGTGSRLVDLQRGTAVTIGASSNGAEMESSTLLSALTPTGALATARWTTPLGAQEATTSGPLTLWSDGAVESLPVLVRGIAPSLGTGPASSGIYTLGDRGDVSRQVVTGPVKPEALAFDSSLRWQSLKLAASPRKKGVMRTELSPGIDLVRRTRSDGSKAIAVEFAHRASARVVLAPGSTNQFKVLSFGYRSILVAGRFADRPAAPRIRLLQPADAPGPELDIPATLEGEMPGHALAAATTVVIAEAERLRIWSRPTPSDATAYREVAAERPYDLAPSSVGLFFTDRDGVPGLLNVFGP